MISNYKHLHGWTLKRPIVPKINYLNSPFCLQVEPLQCPSQPFPHLKKMIWHQQNTWNRLVTKEKGLSNLAVFIFSAWTNQATAGYLTRPHQGRQSETHQATHAYINYGIIGVTYQCSALSSSSSVFLVLWSLSDGDLISFWYRRARLRKTRVVRSREMGRGLVRGFRHGRCHCRCCSC